MTEHPFAFLSHSRNDRQPAIVLQKQLEQGGLSVFRDDSGIAGREHWLNVLQKKVETCSWFVVLVGRDGVRRWMGAEASVALFRHINPQRDDERLPIFPILLGDTRPGTLPGFLRQFQAIRWDGAGALREDDLERTRDYTAFGGDRPVFEGVDASAFANDAPRVAQRLLMAV